MNLHRIVFHRIRNFKITGKVNFAARPIDHRTNIVFLAIFGTRCFLNSLLHRLQVPPAELDSMMKKVGTMMMTTSTIMMTVGTMMMTKLF